MAGSATAEMSVVPRRLPQGVAPSCHAGRASSTEQPLPAPDQALSVQPRAVPEARVRLVPPTATTRGEVAG